MSAAITEPRENTSFYKFKENLVALSLGQ